MKQLFELPTTFAEFLENLHPKDMVVSLMHIRTIEDSVHKERTKLKDLETTYGMENAVNYIEIWLKILQEKLNVKNPIIDIRTIAIMIYDAFSHLHVTDMKLVFDKIMFARGVKFYGSVDSNAILGAFTDFNQERNLYLKKKSNTIISEDSVLYHEMLVEVQNELWERLEVGKIAKECRYPEWEKILFENRSKIHAEVDKRVYQLKQNQRNEQIQQ